MAIAGNSTRAGVFLCHFSALTLGMASIALGQQAPADAPPRDVGVIAVEQVEVPRSVGCH